MPFAEIIIK